MLDQPYHEKFYYLIRICFATVFEHGFFLFGYTSKENLASSSVITCYSFEDSDKISFFTFFSWLKKPSSHCLTSWPPVPFLCCSFFIFFFIPWSPKLDVLLQVWLCSVEQRDRSHFICSFIIARYCLIPERFLKACLLLNSKVLKVLPCTHLSADTWDILRDSPASIPSMISGL